MEQVDHQHEHPGRDRRVHAHQAAGLAGRDDHRDRGNDVERREREVAGSGDPRGADRSGEGIGHRPPLVDGDDGGEHEEVQTDHQGADLQQDPEPRPEERSEEARHREDADPDDADGERHGEHAEPSTQTRPGDDAVLQRLDHGGGEEREGDGPDDQEDDDPEQASLEAEEAGRERRIEAGPDRRERQQVRERRERTLVPRGDQHQPDDEHVEDRRDHQHRRAQDRDDPAGERRPHARHRGRAGDPRSEHRIEDPPLRCGRRGLRIAVPAGRRGGPAVFFLRLLVIRPPPRDPRPASSGVVVVVVQEGRPHPTRGASVRPGSRAGPEGAQRRGRRGTASEGRSRSATRARRACRRDRSRSRRVRARPRPCTPTTTCGASARLRSSPLPCSLCHTSSPDSEIDRRETSVRGGDQHAPAGDDGRAPYDRLVHGVVPDPVTGVGVQPVDLPGRVDDHDRIRGQRRGAREEHRVVEPGRPAIRPVGQRERPHGLVREPDHDLIAADRG